MQLDKKLYEEINEYCKLNNLKTRDFIHKKLNDAFLMEKYGDMPFYANNKTVIPENIVIETIKNEPVEPEIIETVYEHFHETTDKANVQNETVENTEENVKNEMSLTEEIVVFTPKLKKKRKLK